MNKLPFRLSFFAALILFTLPARADNWVFMAYMFGQGSLECQALSSFQQMAHNAGRRNLDIWVQLARPTAHCSDSENPYHGDYKWTGVRRFHITRGHDKPENGTTINSGMEEPSTLTDFVRYVAAQTTGKDSNHYVLIFSGHGTGLDIAPLKFALLPAPDSDGINKGLASHSGTPLVKPRSFVLSIAGIHQALKDAGVKLDLIAFDACVMGNIEAAYSMFGLTEAFVASQERVPLPGFDYRSWLRSVSCARSPSHNDVARFAVTSYGDRYRDARIPYPGSGLDLFTTLSAVNVAKVKTFSDGFKNFTGQLTGSLNNPTYAYGIDTARRKCLSFASTYGVQDQIDLKLFLENIAISEALPRPLKTQASSLLSSLGQSIIESYKSHQDSQYGADGLSIYFPLPESKRIPDYDTSLYNPFGADTGWIDFLNAYRKLYPAAPAHGHGSDSSQKN